MKPTLHLLPRHQTLDDALARAHEPAHCAACRQARERHEAAVRTWLVALTSSLIGFGLGATLIALAMH